MADAKNQPKGSTPSSIISIGKDLMTLLRDGSLLVLAILLFAFPKTFNEMLVNAGFVKGSIAGFEWQSGLVQADEQLKQANAAIAELRNKNDAIAQALSEASKRLNDPSLTERTAKLNEENDKLRKSSGSVQASVEQTIRDNAPLVQKAISSAASSGSARRTQDYFVGLQTFGIPDKAREDLNAKIQAAGYGLHELSASYQGERPSWFAPESTVLYYSAVAQSAAKELADRLKQLTGTPFAIQRGSGLGVDPSQRDVTLFVHYIKK
jgi:hypothetical protein